MKKIYLIPICFFALSGLLFGQERYLEPIFDGFTKETVVYSTNISVITGEPVPVQLEMDIYQPEGDDVTDRPLFLYFHTGNFLPNPLNGSTGGTRTDSVLMEMVSRLTSKGYVVAVPDYRKGWNPLGDLDTRISTLINAAYRGIQDARTAVRFFRKDVVDHGNNYGVHPDRIAYIGQGTGGYISFGAATLDNYVDILIPKFFGPDITGDGNPDPYVIQPIHGDPFGTLNAAASLANLVTYDDGTPISSDVSLTVNMGGALGDTSWVSENNPPMISFHVPTDPFAPYMEDVLIVPTTGDLIVEVQGSYLAQQKANALGLNNIFIEAELNDPFTQAANANNDGLEGLFPLIRPTWTNPLNNQPAFEGSPWDWWDADLWSQQPHPNCPDGTPIEVCNFHVISGINNPDMSAEKGRTYVDTIIGYMIPRAYIAFGLGDPSSTQEINASQVGFKMFPNPASGAVHFIAEDNAMMKAVEIYDIQGRLVYSSNSLETNRFELSSSDFPSGIYITRVMFDEGVVTDRLIIQ